MLRPALGWTMLSRTEIRQAERLANWERVVSERLFHDSKMLGRIRSQVVNLLICMDPRWEGMPPDEAEELLESYGVRRKPGLIRCAGAGVVRTAGREYRLEDFIPVAHLPDSWSDAWVHGLVQADVRQITTIENEYPFLSYVEESGGASGLGARHEVAVFTGGFPTPRLVAALVELAECAPSVQFRHWGDASERDALMRLASQMNVLVGEDVQPVLELIDELRRGGIKLEQERY